MVEVADAGGCDGGVGYLPSPYLETIQRRPQAQIAASSAPTSEAGSRVNTITGSTVFDPSRANSMKITEKEKAAVKLAPKELPAPGDVTLESFQRGGFYS